jgi:hypothetical protein|tara:strand:- start:1580 stop:1933 length:354 start_codon:yes stop_codon:yes gene_type:complete
MKLLTKEIEAKLSKNSDKPTDKPYLKLFNPLGPATWLLTTYDKKTGLFYGLCDLGMGFPELGYVSLKELEKQEVGLGLGIERDINWEPELTIREYTDMATKTRSILDCLYPSAVANK